jgi:DNA-binding CsgD family transcriptional regulator
VQKAEMISNIKEELTRLAKKVENDTVSSEFKKLIRVLGEDDKTDKNWEQFEEHFDTVHSDFLARLKQRHPEVSPNEVKLCTYLRLSLSSKEIARLMNISVRGVEISRYRLRKKLGIATEVTLYDYLSSLEDDKQGSFFPSLQ